jgi:molybdopterin converting factor small subunit
MEIAIILLLTVIVIFSILNYLAKPKSSVETAIEDKKRISELEKDLATKETEIKHKQQNIELANAKNTAFEQLKSENTTLREKLSNIERERNQLKNETITLKKEEENRNETLRKSIE